MAMFTDIFIRRPVLATVISLLIFVMGLRAIFTLQLRQYPEMNNTVITVTTAYPGASGSVVQGFVTTPLEKQIAAAEGLDYLTSSSTDGVSTIQAYIRLNYDPDKAFTNVLSKVQVGKQNLPKESQEPVVDKSTGQTFALLYAAFRSSEMSPEQITNYVEQVVVPELQTVSGVAQVQVLGGGTYAMRIWLNTQKMAGLGITPTDVSTALQSKNVQAAAGHTRGQYIQITIKPKTDVNTAEDFKNILIKKGSNGQLVYLRDIARVELGQETYDSSVYFNGEKAVFIAVYPTPTANPLTTITDVEKMLPKLSKNFPPSLSVKTVWDATKFIRASIHEVIWTIVEASLIVVIVIFLFLGSIRTVTIPIVTIPLSLVGVAAVMLFLGYSLNLLTLLAMVLAIGMVVDDAIVVVENIYRHIEEGLTPYDAAIKGAREIATPVISMTITLAAVYAPIGFMGGVTGALFKEFAFTLASTVIISGVIALTLSPMMCSKVLSANIANQKFVHMVDATFDWVKVRYERWLRGALNYIPVTVFFAFVVLLSCVFLYTTASKELAPTEDQGVAFTMVTGPQTATLDYMEAFTSQLNNVYTSIPSMSDSFIVNGMNGVNSTISGVMLKPWDERKQSQDQVVQIINQKTSQIPGLQFQTFPLPSLPGTGSGFPIQFEITSTSPLSRIYPVMQDIVTAAQKSGLFIFVNGSLRFDKPEMVLDINRAKAEQLGIGIDTIAQSLAIALGGNYVNWFSVDNRSYEVIPQVSQRYRLNPEQIEQIYLKTASGALVPLSTVVTVKYDTTANTLSRFQQLNSAEIGGLPRPGVTVGTALQFLQQQAEKVLPSGMSYDYAGASRQYIEEGSTLMVTFFFSIIVIYLVLAAQFESLRDPLVVMISVPMAISGALIGINAGLATVNIYTQIGLITLIGLISKHGILMVEFANKLQQNEKLSPHEAIIQSASIRLRPVLMTTFAMILGVFPLILASGAGAASRFDIGMVIAMGMFIGTTFTLFVVPTMYMLRTRKILQFLASVAIVATILYLAFYGI